MSIQPLTGELFSVSDQLIAAMEREIEHLKQHRIADMSGLQAEKNALSMRYQQVMADLMARGEELHTLSDAERRGIRDAQAKFKRTARRNKNAIKSRINVTQRLIDTVVAALQDRQTDASGVYNRHGAIETAGSRDYAGMTQAPRISVSLDQKL